MIDLPSLKCVRVGMGEGALTLPTGRQAQRRQDAKVRTLRTTSVIIKHITGLPYAGIWLQRLLSENKNSAINDSLTAESKYMSLLLA